MKYPLVILLSLLLLIIAGLTLFNSNGLYTDTITVGIYPHMPPYQYMEDGELKGFEIELISEIADRLHYKIVFVESDYKYENYLNAKNGNVDISISAITKTKERRDEVIFSNFYMRSYGSIITNNENYSKITDLNNKKIGVLSNSTFEELALSHRAEINSEIVPYNSFESLHTDLSDKKIDAAYTDYFYYLATKNEYPDVYFLENVYDHYFGMVSNNPKLIEKVNRELDNMEEDGSLQKLHDKYFTEPEITITN